MTKEERENEVWNKVFPLQKGVKVRLIRDTIVVCQETGKETLIPEGTVGKVEFYRDGSPVIYVKFEEHNTLIMVSRVKKVFT